MNDHYKEWITDSFLLQNQKDVWEFQLKTAYCNVTAEVRAKYIAILRYQREYLNELNKNPRINEQLIRSFERQLNLEEEKWESSE